MSDAVIRFGGTTVPVQLRGAEGPRGAAGPDTGEAIEDAVVALYPIGKVSAALPDGNDQSAVINAELADPAVTSLALPFGTIDIASGLIVPDGKELYGQGPGLTTLRAMVNFEDSIDNATMILLEGEGTRVRDMTVDANKRGNGEGSTKRCNGVVSANGCTGYLKQNLVVQNCSGYAVYDAGSSALTAPPSGRNVNIKTFNCQVHFEPQGVDGVTYEDCHARDGDGDIACLQWFHPLVGAKNVRHYACTGYGAAGAGVDITANIADVENVLFDGCDIEVTGSTVAFSVGAGVNDTTGLNLTNCRIVSQDGVGMVLYNAYGSMAQTRISGNGVGIEANDSDIICTGCEAYSYSNPAGSSASKGIYAPGSQQIRWNGGKIEAVGPVGLMIPYEGGVIVDSGALLIPASTGPSIDVDGNIETDAGLKVKGQSPLANTISLEFGYTSAAGGYVQAIDRTGGGAVDKGFQVFGGFKVNAGPSFALSATFSPAGLDLVSGDVYSINGQRVVTGRLTALPADATDLATALTLVNAIKARLKVTGGHGLVAD